MGVLPLEFTSGIDLEKINLTGFETFSLSNFKEEITPGQNVILEINRSKKVQDKINLKLRIDTPIEVTYYKNGGILKYVLKDIIKNQNI